LLASIRGAAPVGRPRMSPSAANAPAGLRPLRKFSRRDFHHTIESHPYGGVPRLVPGAPRGRRRAWGGAMRSPRTPGPLVIIGGAEDKKGDCTILREFVRLAGGA